MKYVQKGRLSNALYLILSPAVLFSLMEWLLRNPFHEKWGMRPVIMIFNLIFFYLLELFLLGITGSLRTALYIEGGFSCLAGVINHYVYRFRGNTIVPWDFLSLKTAFSVADNYSYSPEVSTIIISFLFFITGVLFYFCGFSIKKNIRARLILSLTSVLVTVFIYVPFVQSEKTIDKYRIYDKLFTPSTMTMRDGTIYAFIYDLKFLIVQKPSGYDRDEAEAMLGEKNRNNAVNEDTPNIIVIMCEAFSDPKVLGEFETNEDYMPFIRSLMDSEDTVSGKLHVSVLGGNTPNTEFEFLTGNTMGFLPEGSIPFQQFITKKTDALPNELKEMGYNTLAMHPYNSTGWNRDKVYPLLGFDKMYFLDHFKERDPKLIRKYVSDESLFNEIINEYKENGRKTPLFSFNVTMQNHSEYSGDLGDFKPEISIRGFDGDSLVERYLSLEKVTDDAFRGLISYFDSIEDPTVVVFFGDHQPNDYVVEPVLNINGKNGKSLTDSERRMRYTVPYLIWANYDIKGRSDLDISANYLGNLVLSAAGIELSGYRDFLNEKMKSYPVISAVEEKRSDGTSKDMDKDDPDLSDYRRVQYYEMFDK